MKINALLISVLIFLLSYCSSTQSNLTNNQNLGCGSFIAVPFQDGLICVSPDYYSVDGIRTPLGYSDALRVADSLGYWLPTTEMVDAIYQHADIKLSPIPMPPTNEMTSRAYYIRHNELIKDQLISLGKPNPISTLIAGHKKDVIAQPRNSTKVGIYGWHTSDSTVIQPFSRVHRRDYFDYSHGIRFIKKQALVNQKWVALPSPY